MSFTKHFPDKGSSPQSVLSSSKYQSVTKPEEMIMKMPSQSAPVTRPELISNSNLLIKSITDPNDPMVFLDSIFDSCESCHILSEASMAMCLATCLGA